MDITPPPRPGLQIVRAYGNGGFRIGDERHVGAVLVLPDAALSWPVSSIEELELEDFGPLREARTAVELLILGTGKSMARMARETSQGLREWGIVVETMDTGAACRTYNFLLLEDRRVAAALFPVD